jgi:hypothetical protein
MDLHRPANGTGVHRVFVVVETHQAGLRHRGRQHNLGSALQALGQRKSGTERLEQAVNAFRNALGERTRERVPLDWATTQNNLGNALGTLGQRESGTERLEQAVEAWDICLVVVTSVWPIEWIEDVRSRRDEAQTEIIQRQAG